MTKGATTYYLAYDQVGSLRLVTDASGNTVKRVDYDSFGNVVSDSSPAFKVPLGFASGLADADTGLMHFGARDYEPSTGRWMQKDPLSLGGGLNVYAYCGGDQMNLVDLQGLRCSAVEPYRTPYRNPPYEPDWAAYKRTLDPGYAEQNDDIVIATMVVVGAARFGLPALVETAGLGKDTPESGLALVEDASAGLEGRITGYSIWNDNHLYGRMVERGVDGEMIEAAVRNPVSVTWQSSNGNFLYEGANHVDVILTPNGTVATTWINPQ